MTEPDVIATLHTHQMHLTDEQLATVLHAKNPYGAARVERSADRMVRTKTAPGQWLHTAEGLTPNLIQQEGRLA